MNIIEKEMLEILKELKHKFGVIQIKAEFENEGSRQVELMRLKDIISKAELPLILKTGGCEAVTDMYEALSLGASGIIAPMVETPFAVNKFLDAIKKFIPEDNAKDIEFAINIETITAEKNIYDILNLKGINILQSITFGRVDYTSSCNLDRSMVDDISVYHTCQEIFKLAKSKGLKTALGGAVSPQSENFIRQLIEYDLIDKYETRKIVYSKNGFLNFQEGLKKGIEFELLWLKSKRRYYHRITIEDEKRIKMLEERIYA